MAIFGYRFLGLILILVGLAMWCTIFNGALLLLWTAMSLLAQNLIYRIQTRWFPIPRETFVVLLYSFLGLFKIAFLVFNLVPYVALMMVGRG